MKLLLEWADGSRLLDPRSTYTLGRGETSEIVIDSSKVSRSHLKFGFKNGSWTVTDLDSANGTYSAGKAIGDLQIKKEMSLYLGGISGFQLRVSLVGAETRKQSDIDQTRVSSIYLSNLSNSRNSSTGASVRIGSRIRIGRDAQNDWTINDLTVSRFHAEITGQDSGNYLLVDLGSANGTFVNGELVKRCALNFGDQVSVGNDTRIFTQEGLKYDQSQEGAELAVQNLQFRIKDKLLLDSVDLTFGAQSLTAIIGPSGAGKSTLLSLLTGRVTPSAGTIEINGINLNEKYESIKNKIGFVPQADIIHTKLTTRQAIAYGAELRLPSEVTKSEREERVQEIINLLELNGREDLRIDKLSGGQRKRVSIALELITNPELLFLDEPTSGLDPGLDAHVMKTLRLIADNGQTVVVVTHSVENLDFCDKVVLMASGGRVAYSGPPSSIFSSLKCKSWAEVFKYLADDAATNLSWRNSPVSRVKVNRELKYGRVNAQSPLRQVLTLSRRYMDVIRADRFYLALLVVVPIVMGFLSYATGSSYGFDQGFMTKAGFRFNPTARTTVMVLVLGTIFIALAASIQEIIKEREIVNREKNAGVRPIAYVASKFLVLSILVSIQITVFAFIVLFKRPMSKIETFSGSPLLSIFIFCLLLGLVTLLLGLLVSASISSSEQAMPTLVGIIMVQIILSGLLPIDFKGVIEKMSPFIPSYVATNGLAGVTNLAQTTFVQDEKLLLRWGTSFENSYSSLSQLGFFLVLFFALTTFVMQKRD